MSEQADLQVQAAPMSPNASSDAPPASTRSPRDASETESRGALGRAGFESDDVLPETHLLDYVRVLYRRRWIACTAFVVVVLIVALYVLTATPIYEATTRLLIESEKQNVVAFKEVVEDEAQPTDAYYQSLYKLIESRALAAKTIETLGLWDNVELCASCRARPAGIRATLIIGVQTAFSWARQLVGQSASQKDSGGTDETARKSQTIDAFLGRLIVSPIKNSRLVDIGFRSTDAALTARVANAHARAYIDKNLEFKFLASKEASDWLAERLAEQRQNVEQSESAVQQYREENDAGSLEEQQNIVVQKLADLNAAVTKAKTERIEKEALYRQLENSGPDMTALDSFPSVQSNVFVQQLKTQLAELERQRAQLSDHLGEEHPEMIKVTTSIQEAQAKLQGEIAKAVQSVHNAYLTAQAQERSLVQALNAQKREALAMNRKGIEGNVLVRDADGNRQLYEGLLKRAMETGVSTELKSSNVRIVDPAEAPRVPVRPNKLQALALAFGGGSFLAVCLAFFFEYLDDRIKTPEEIRTLLRLPMLGMVPRVAPELLGPHPLISNGVPLNFAEAFRTVRTSVLFFSMPDCPDARPHRVMVTSTAPGEGKTVSASNLAVGIAQAGKRVLLVDCDMRRSRIHEIFGLPQEPGLSNLLVGNARATEVFQPSGVEGLWVLTAGRIPPNPSELLSAQRFKDLLPVLDGYFDWIVLDSSPTLAVTDASIVAHLVDGILFVIGSEMTSRRAVRAALERLEQADGRLIGVVLNRANLDQHSYYYGQYQREYANYYGG
jgi:capsular exopolysaccharide synthesis family protein